MSYRQDWRSNFRHTTYRPNQEEALDRIGTHLDNGVKVVVGEIPTGVGKSDIAMALARCTDNAYIATSLNPLIDQYVKDFGESEDFWYIKGRTNYFCPESEEGNCLKGSERKCHLYETKPEEGQPMRDFQSPCDYKANRNLCSRKQIALTNLTYFGVAIRPSAEHTVWNKRKLAIIDEAHNLPDEVLNMVSLVISNKDLYDCGIVEDVNLQLGPGEVVDQDRFTIFILDLKSKITSQIIKLSKDSTSAMAFADAIKNMNEMLDKINWYHMSIECGVEWLVELIKSESKGRTYHKVQARPIESGYFAQNLFFKHQAEQYLLQSATIIDPQIYCTDLGIEKFEYVEEPSPFDLPRRRPIFLMNSGDMGHKNLDATLPNAIKDVHNIILAYRGKRGLIHTVSYGLQKKLEEKFASNPRCIFMTPDNREDSFEKFYRTNDAVLFSAALMEGFDGKDDVLRFQVLMKIPYPDFGDKRIKIKAERNRRWYNYQAKKPLIQSVGRGMRGADDWCDFYVVDTRFEKFAQSHLPREMTNTMYGQGSALTRMRKMYKDLV